MERCEHVAQMERYKLITSSQRHYGKKTTCKICRSWEDKTEMPDLGFLGL
jgi:hypothetical protein